MKHLILILLIVILLYIIIYNKEKFLINEEKWQDYRLGDIVDNYFRYKNQHAYLKSIEKRLPNSIGSLYIKNTEKLDREKQGYNYDLLNEIINQKKKNIKLPDKDDIVIHLRLGDIIKGTKNNIKFQSNYWYGTNIEKLDKEIKKIKKFNNVYLVYGSHRKNINVELNNQYLDNIKKMLEKNNIKPILINTNPDNDFIFMACSKNFIRSGGGFSNIISNLVEKNGGVVYVPK